MKRYKEFFSRNRGQALLEFALIFPIVIIFLFSIVDFGIAVDRRITLQHAVREGARKGAVAADMTDIVNVTVDQSQGLLGPADVEVCYEDTDGNGSTGDPGDNVRVTATFTYDFTVAITEVFNAFGATLPSGITMTPSADMRLENSVSPAPPCAFIPLPTVPPP
jgi:Flp pilus assembly protein TadG